MLINFDSDSRQQCNNCGRNGTLMHLVFTPSDLVSDLCRQCFEALATAMLQALRKFGGKDAL